MIRAWRVNTCLTAMFYPKNRLAVARWSRAYLRPLLSDQRTTKWNPETTAVVVISYMLKHIIEEETTVGDRARITEHIVNDQSDLADEMQWIARVQAKQIDVSAMSHLEYRLNWIGCLAARWLVDGKIDIPTKSLLVTAIAMALTESPQDETSARLGQIISQIGA